MTKWSLKNVAKMYSNSLPPENNKMSVQQMEDYLINTSQTNYEWFLEKCVIMIYYNDINWKKVAEMRMIKGIIE
jgi:hypothetical protein